MSLGVLVIGLVLLAVTLVTQLQWLRVAQREHYAPGRVLAIAALWCRARPSNTVHLIVIAVACVVGLLSLPFVAIGTILWIGWPSGLALASRTARLTFTSRAKRLVAVVVVLHVVVALLLTLVGAVSLLPLLVIPVAELGLLVARPIEARLSRKYQVSAAARIQQVHPRVVAITGSYGKTSTKNYATHLIAGRHSVLASPASFNNVLGLSRAVNDRLVPGTDVFVAEMGTYGPGEIAALCEIFPPEVSAITTIGEAHLERMKNRSTIVRAKSEILPPARTVVLNVDVPELAAAADDLEATKRVLRCSVADAPGADVALRREGEGWVLRLGGGDHPVTLPPGTGHPINVAIAVGLALAVDVPVPTILDRIATVPATPHRAEATRLPDGPIVIDDTYNSNPEGAAQALVTATSLVGEGGTVWTVTPGMVELGPEQAARNADLARAATATAAMQLCIVGRTNRRALRAGEADRTHLFGSREDAAKHVMATAAAGDVVLYENDLPDHYP